MTKTTKQIIDELSYKSSIFEKLLVYYLVQNGVIEDPKPGGIPIGNLIFEALLFAQQEGLIPNPFNISPK